MTAQSMPPILMCWKSWGLSDANKKARQASGLFMSLRRGMETAQTFFAFQINSTFAWIVTSSTRAC